MNLLTRWRSLLPPLLAFPLLFAQAAIPWTVSWFATEDGPSHLYSAVVASNLMLHRGNTHFSSVYRINPRIMPNWTATILLAVIGQTAGVDHAEKAMASLCMCVGFFAFAHGLFVAVPEEGMGGAIIKVRFVWGFFLLGGLLAASARRLRRFQLPMAIYIGGFLIGNLVVTSQTLSDSSDLIGDYLAGAGQPHRAATMILYRYPTPDLPARYAIEGIGRDPLFHLDALVAARCRSSI
jgi:hypothetical protein